MSNVLMAELERLAKFPAGTSADPTKNMTPAQKAEWEAMNEEHGDNFKQAAETPFVLEEGRHFKTASGDLLDQLTHVANGCKKLPEGPMRDNCESGGPIGGKGKGKKKDKAKGKGDGKMPADLLEKFKSKKKADELADNEELFHDPLALNDVTACGDEAVAEDDGFFAEMLKTTDVEDDIEFPWETDIVDSEDDGDLFADDLEANAIHRQIGKRRKRGEDDEAGDDKEANPVLRNRLKKKRADEDDKDAGFEKGKPADPTENMSDEQKAEWEKQKALNKDNFKGKSAGEDWMITEASLALAKKVYSALKRSGGMASMDRSERGIVYGTFTLGDERVTAKIRIYEGSYGGMVVMADTHGSKKIPLPVRVSKNPKAQDIVQEVMNALNDMSMGFTRVASVSGDEWYYKASDGNWYLEYELTNEEATHYGPFSSEEAAENWRYKNLSNTGGSSSDDSGRAKPPRNPVSPRRNNRFRYADDFFAEEFDQLAEGCPDNLDADDCKKWEANTEEHGDKFKTAGCEKLPNEKMQQLCEDKKKDASWETGEVDDDSPLDGERTEDASAMPDGEGNVDKRAADALHTAARKLSAILQAMGVPAGHLNVKAAKTADVEVVSWWVPGDDSENLIEGARMSDRFMAGMKAAGFRPVGRSTWGDGNVTVLAEAGRRGATIEVSVPNTGRLAARVPGGLYGFPKAVQADCETCTRKVGRQAAKIARRIHAKDPKVADFLTTHAKRSKSLTAKVLLGALRDMAPKVASEDKTAAVDLRCPNCGDNLGKDTENDRWAYCGNCGEEDIPNPRGEAQPGDKGPVRQRGGYRRWAGDKEARTYGLYGFGDKTASLGLNACTEMRSHVGKVAYDLHKRRAGRHAQITAFLKIHCKTAKCSSSQLLSDCYPGSDCKVASPVTVDDWLSWED